MPRESANERHEIEKIKDSLIDVRGTYTEAPLNRKVFIGAGLAVITYAVCTFIPIDNYGAGTARALGMLLATVAFSTFWCYSIAVPALLCAVAGIALGHWTWDDVSSALGSSPMYTMIGMQIVAYGCEFTPLGTRLAYWFLRQFGQKPVHMVVVIGVVTAVISSLVSDLAVLIMMSGIAATLLNAMGEKPGKSRIGKAMMLTVTCMSLVGGTILICGSPSGNMRAISFMEAASDGKFSITFGQWAAFGVPSFILFAIPANLIYVKCAGLKNSQSRALPRSYYDEKLNSLGKIGGSEIRWIIIVAAMIVSMVSGVGAGEAALTFALISILPGVGVVPAKKALGKIPWDNVLALCTFPLLGNLLTSTGLGDFITAILKPVMGGMSPLTFSIAACLTTGILVNIFVNANIAVCALCVTIFTPVCISLGYNPTVILYPTLCVVSLFFCIGSNTMVLMNKGYGYWEMKDPILPGFLVVILFSLIYPCISVAVSGLVGLDVLL